MLWEILLLPILWLISCGIDLVLKYVMQDDFRKKYPSTKKQPGERLCSIYYGRLLDQKVGEFTNTVLTVLGILVPIGTFIAISCNKNTIDTMWQAVATLSGFLAPVLGWLGIIGILVVVAGSSGRWLYKISKAIAKVQSKLDKSE